MIEIGRLAGTKLIEIPKEVLTESVPGKVYHLHIETKGIPNEEEVARALIGKLYEKFKAKVIWIRIEDGVIDLQLIGSPFAWAALLAFLPFILAALGVIMVLLSVYGVVTAIPAWVWALAIAGLGIIYFGPRLANLLFGGYKAYEVVKA